MRKKRQDIKDDFKKALRSIRDNIWSIVQKEFGFRKYNEETGLLKTKDNEDYEYRGLTLYMKEIAESILAIGIIMCAFLLLYKMAPVKITSEGVTIVKICSIQHSIKTILFIAGFYLSFDAMLLIAVLISSPGIEEAIDSVTISIAAFLVMLLSNNFESESFLLPVTITLLSIVIVFLIWSKHEIKERYILEKSRKEKKRKG